LCAEGHVYLFGNNHSIVVMCGIIGITALEGILGEPIGKIVRRCLERLEYRGYDSVGIAVINGGLITVRKGKGKVQDVSSRLGFDRLLGSTALGHTRWATHGKPSDENAHPHIDCTGNIVVIHNGIVSNFLELREELRSRGHVFRSETDTEVIPHLMEEYLREGMDPMEAFRRILSRIRGAYALVLATSREPHRLYFARNTSPLVIGIGNGVNFVASDIPAFLEYTNTIIVLRDGEYGYVEPGRVYIEKDGVPVDPEGRVRSISWTPEMASKEGYPHFMLKEIHEQPIALSATLASLGDSALRVAAEMMIRARRVFIVGAGTSYHAGLVGEYLLSVMGGVDARAFIASEYRRYTRLIGDDDLVLAISQSGETVDTLVAVRAFRNRGARVVALSNVVDSAIPRESHISIYTRVGPEIGVAATKTFTAQLMILTALAAKVGLFNGVLSTNDVDGTMDMLSKVPNMLRNLLTEIEGKVKLISRNLSEKNNAYYLGRGIGVPLSMEGALKLKEVAYIHAEAYPAGESKHGPIALVNEDFPVIFSILNDENVEPLLGNVMEMKARGAYTVGLVPRDRVSMFRDSLDFILEMPSIDYRVAPIIYAVPMQLIAYYTAISRGYDPDKPRNLAKTVTVE